MLRRAIHAWRKVDAQGVPKEHLAGYWQFSERFDPICGRLPVTLDYERAKTIDCAKNKDRLTVAS